jgi:hypothetical protein
MSKNEKMVEKVIGTNCYNCLYIANQETSTDAKELNDEGGIDPKNKEEMERAKKADLITLPGGSKTDAKTKRYCNNGQVKMFVTARMCCAYWDNVSVKRPWKK